MTVQPAYFAAPIRRLVACVMKLSRRNLVWKNSSSLVSAERGDLQNDFIEITEDEANQLMEQLRARWTGTSNA